MNEKVPTEISIDFIKLRNKNSRNISILTPSGHSRQIYVQTKLQKVEINVSQAPESVIVYGAL